MRLMFTITARPQLPTTSRSHVCITQRIEAMGGEIDAMAHACTDMQSRVAETRSQTNDLIARAAHLQHQRRAIEVHTDVLHAFQSRFSLDADDRALLTTQKGLDMQVPCDVTAYQSTFRDVCAVLWGAGARPDHPQPLEGLAARHPATGWPRHHRPRCWRAGDGIRAAVSLDPEFDCCFSSQRVHHTWQAAVEA